MRVTLWPGREAKTRVAIILFLAFLAGPVAEGDEQSDGRSTAADTTTKYLETRQVTDPRFITSVERTGPCTLRGPPVENRPLMVPYQLYPPESLRRHEEGTVKVQLIFDSNWCVRKAIVVESSTYWRLDQVSLQWAMFVKWTPSKTLLTPEGEPTVTIPVAWGESQDKRGKR